MALSLHNIVSHEQNGKKKKEMKERRGIIRHEEGKRRIDKKLAPICCKSENKSHEPTREEKKGLYGFFLPCCSNTDHQ